MARLQRVAQVRQLQERVKKLEGDLRLTRNALQNEVRRRTEVEAKLQTVGEILAPFIQPYIEDPL